MRKDKEYLNHQDITLVGVLESDVKACSPAAKMLFVFIVGVCVGAMILAGMRSCEKYQPALVSEECRYCHNRQMSMSQFFERKGSPTPQKMAEAVLATTRPLLMAKIAVRESNGNPKAVGDSGKSKGAFQNQEKHWAKLMREGKVSSDPITQALDAERIFDYLLAENKGNLHKALNAYGGDKTKKTYAKNILNGMKEIP